MNGQYHIPMEPDEESPTTLLTVRDVAELLHVHPNTVRQWSDEGLLKAVRLGPRGDRRFSIEEIIDVIAMLEPDRECSVLIVDDDPEVRQLIIDIVTKQGCEGTAVGSGERALEELERRNFDLVFVDLVLSGLSGLEVLRAVKASGASTVVAVVTGYGEEPIALEAMALGPMFFLRKPFRTADIIEVIHATIQINR